jgi:predicted permease
MPPLPRLSVTLLRALLPVAERDELLADLEAEYAERVVRDGTARARRWWWTQCRASLPALLRRSWQRGWSGFDSNANRTRPGGAAMERWIFDLRHSARRLVRRPAYAIVAILTLALGIGGTAAVATMARGLLLEPLPFARPGELVAFWHTWSWSSQEFLHLRGRFPGFASVAAYRPEDLTLQQGDAPARVVPGLAVSHEFFDLLGTPAALGRTFEAGEDATGVEATVVLSHAAWRDLGARPQLVGERLVLDGVPRTVVGVMPERFWYPDPSVRAWVPAPLDPQSRSGIYSFIGRLAPGQTVDAMGPALEQLGGLLNERFDYPEQWDPTRAMVLTPMREALVGALRPALLATLGAMAVILLIACANVAALMLGQVEGRTTELAVRSALGAERGRLVQQLLVEALLVGVTAGVAGAAIAAAGFSLLAGALPLGAWGAAAVPHWGVFWVAMGVSLAAALLVALVPVVTLWRGDLRDALGRARTGGVAGRGGRLEGGLVVAEVAMAVIMTASAALLGRSVSNLYAIDPGIAADGAAVVDLAFGDFITRPQRAQLLRDLVAASQSLPGVRSVAFTQKLPLRGSGDNWGISVEGRPDLQASTTAYRVVSRDYLPTMGMPLLRGRGFESYDRQGSELVVLVNEALAQQYFPGVDPIGRRISSGFDTTWARIVGVVRTAAEASLTDPPQPARYMLADQVPWVSAAQSLVLRVAPGSDPAALLPAARRVVERTAPGVAVRDATTLSVLFGRAVGPVRQVMTLLAVLTALALTLGAVGVYGVISHFAARRQRDWGIRLALGLRPSQVVRHIVGRGVSLVAAGVALGVVAAVSLVRLLASFLYGVGASDPLPLATASGILLAVGALAAWIPARRAGRVHPAVVLREQ